ncbi:MAG: TetR/AcrR family transcriptional regulator [Sphaerochaetaceae bacterium]
MTRKTGVVSEDTRQSLLRSAKAVIWEKGYEAAGLREVCDRAEVTTGALYFFFRSKEDLFRQLLEPVARTIVEFMENHYRLEDESRMLFGETQEDINFTRTIIRLYDSDPQMYDIIVRNWMNPVVAKYLSQIMETMDRHTLNLLRTDASDVAVLRAVHWFSELQLEAFIKVVSVRNNPEERSRQMHIAIQMLRGALLALYEAARDGKEERLGNKAHDDVIFRETILYHVSTGGYKNEHH